MLSSLPLDACRGETGRGSCQRKAHFFFVVLIPTRPSLCFVLIGFFIELDLFRLGFVVSN